MRYLLCLLMFVLPLWGRETPHATGYKPLTPEKLAAYRAKSRDMHGGRIAMLARNQTLPAAFDCREKGWALPVGDQGSCGSCYLYSTVQTASAAFVKAGYGKPDGSFMLAVQYGMDCQDFGGCNGGNGTEVIDWMCKNGWPAESYVDAAGKTIHDYPAYEARSRSCRTVSGAKKWTPAHWGYVNDGGNPTTAEIKTAMFNYGVLNVALDAGGQFDKGTGTITSLGKSINHEIQVVAWDDAKDGGAFLLQNQWSTAWGNAGCRWCTYKAAANIVDWFWVSAAPLPPPPPPPPLPPVPPTPPTPPPVPGSVTITLSGDLKAGTYKLLGKGEVVIDPKMTLEDLGKMLRKAEEPKPIPPVETPEPPKAPVEPMKPASVTTVPPERDPLKPDTSAALRSLADFADRPGPRLMPLARWDGLDRDWQAIRSQCPRDVIEDVEGSLPFLSVSRHAISIPEGKQVRAVFTRAADRLADLPAQPLPMPDPAPELPRRKVEQAALLLPAGAERYEPTKWTQSIYVLSGHGDRIDRVPTSGLEAKWRHSGGMADFAGVTSEKYRYMPTAPRTWIGDIAVLNRFGSFQNNRGLKVEYASGTRFDDVLSYEGKVFEHRTREKKDGGRWSSKVVFTDKAARPPGYTGLKVSCASCHNMDNGSGTGGYAVGLVPGGDTVISDPLAWNLVRLVAAGLPGGVDARRKQ